MQNKNPKTNKKTVIFSLDIQVISPVTVMVKTPYRSHDCGKPRQTPHQRRPTRTIVTRSQSHTRGVRFSWLPSEVFETILDKMSCKCAACRSKNSEISQFKHCWIQKKCVYTEFFFCICNFTWSINIMLFRKSVSVSCTECKCLCFSSGPQHLQHGVQRNEWTDQGLHLHLNLEEESDQWKLAPFNQPPTDVYI